MCRPRPFLTSPLVVSSALMASSAVACAERAEAAVVEYREVFAFHDGNYDGRLTTAEFCAAVRSLGHAPTAMQVRLKRARPRVGRARRARGASLPPFHLLEAASLLAKGLPLCVRRASRFPRSRPPLPSPRRSSTRCTPPSRASTRTVRAPTLLCYAVRGHACACTRATPTRPPRPVSRHPPPTKRALAGLAFADFVKVLGTIVEPKIPRASAVAPAASAGLAAFEQLCRRQLTGSLKKRDLAAFLRSPDPLAADEAERFMRFVSAALLRGNGERGRARRHLNPAASAVLLPPHRRSAWATPRRLTKSNIARSSRR